MRKNSPSLALACSGRNSTPNIIIAALSPGKRSHEMLDTNWIQPSVNIIPAAYAQLVVADLEKAKSLYVDVLGFVVTSQTADCVYWRGYEEHIHHSRVLRQGDT